MYVSSAIITLELMLKFRGVSCIGLNKVGVSGESDGRRNQVQGTRVVNTRGVQRNVKIRVLSDLHLEFQHWAPPKVDADVVVLAGDIHVGIQGVEWARRHFARSLVVCVPGNHEFALHGTDLSSIDRAMVDADCGMNDFRLIRYGGRGRFLAKDARAIHLAQVRWLRIKLAEKFPGPTIVVTHHLPHRHSIHPRYEGSDLNPSFSSDLSDLMGPSALLWIHGHTHESFDYVVNGTRVVCKPRGYARMDLNRRPGGSLW